MGRRVGDWRKKTYRWKISPRVGRTMREQVIVDRKWWQGKEIKEMERRHEGRKGMSEGRERLERE